jgi:hypothetical protein
MYLKALMVLNHTDNLDHFARCAHGVRELMEKIPAFLDVQTRAHQESLGSKEPFAFSIRPSSRRS